MQREQLQEFKKNARRRKPRKTGSLQDVLAIQWQAIEAARVNLLVCDEAGNIGGVFTAVHCLSQAGSVYARMLEAGDLEKRIQALEAAEAARANPNMKRVA